jgi:hypothetical protein
MPDISYIDAVSDGTRSDTISLEQYNSVNRIVW